MLKKQVPNLKFEPQKRLPATIWLKKACSLCFQKRNSIAGPGPSKMPNLSSKKFPGQDLAQKGLFALLPEEKFNSRPRAVQNAKFELQKAPGQDLAQNGCSPCFQKRNSIDSPGPSEMPNLSSKRLPGQDLAQKGLFPLLPEKKFNSRPGAVQNANLGFTSKP